MEGDTAIVEAFVSDYLGLLDQRLASVHALLSSGDTSDDLRVSILSLETASAMIGAADVVTAAQALRLAVLRRETSLARGLYTQLEAAVAALRVSLGGQGFRCRPAV